MTVAIAAMLGVVATCGLAVAQMAPDELDFSDFAIEESVSGGEGDPAAGRDVFVNRSLGNCVACHVNSDVPDADFQGNVGPSLDGVADRWEPEQLRAIIADPKKIFGEQTIMPAFYSLDLGVNIREDLKGKTILTVEQVEDMVAYLSTLSEE